jgi:hypothetical protein
MIINWNHRNRYLERGFVRNGRILVSGNEASNLSNENYFRRHLNDIVGNNAPAPVGIITVTETVIEEVIVEVPVGAELETTFSDDFNRTAGEYLGQNWLQCTKRLGAGTEDRWAGLNLINPGRVSLVTVGSDGTGFPPADTCYIPTKLAHPEVGVYGARQFAQMQWISATETSDFGVSCFTVLDYGLKNAYTLTIADYVSVAPRLRLLAWGTSIASLLEHYSITPGDIFRLECIPEASNVNRLIVYQNGIEILETTDSSNGVQQIGLPAMYIRGDGWGTGGTSIWDNFEGGLLP